MEKQYNRVKAASFVEIESIIYLAHAHSAEVVEEMKRFDFWQMYYCASGILGIKSNDTVINLPEYHAIFLEPKGDYRTVMRARKEEDAELYVISFACNSAWLKKVANQTIHLYGGEPAMVSELCTVGRRILEPIKMNQERQGLCVKEASHPAVLQYVKISLEQLLIKIYCRLYRIGSLKEEGAKSNRVHYEKGIAAMAHKYMYDHITARLTIQDIAQGLGVNESTLRSVYKKETGKSIMQAFSDMKTAEARRLIRETNLNFTQIGDYLGFLSLYHFSRFFKEKEGITLSEYSRLAEK
ncbi:MAG: helix-turn-helix transcriptional regulator [Lachnospiraceae bacterium]|nr:helix-turn-helix transcriptional regulator [Lachnospiraceae bacterium]